LKKALIVILVLCAAAVAQPRHQVAVLPTVADANALDREGQILLTDKVREIASNTLPIDRFILLKQDVIVNRLGGEEEFFNTCKEGTCIAELTKRISADYGARCDIMKRGDDLAMKFELYSVRDEAILETFTKYPAKDLFEMLAELEARLPDAFKKMLDVPKIPQDGIGQDMAGIKILSDGIDKNQEQQRPEAEKAQKRGQKKKTAFITAIGFDILGAGIAAYGLLEDANVKKQSDANAKKDFDDRDLSGAEKSRTVRNTAYIIGGAMLAAGISIHIIF